MKTILEKKLVIDTKVLVCQSLESAVPTTPLEVIMDEKLRRSFFTPKTVNITKIMSRENKELPLEITPRLDRGFFKSNDVWTSYRRNYFQISVGFKIAQEGFISAYGSLQKIDGFKVLLRAQIQDTMAKIPLLKHTSKREKTMAVEPGARDILPNGTPGSMTDVDAGKVVTFDRIQFRNATGNNGKRRKGQQFYNLIIEIHAICGNKSYIVGEMTSDQLIIRGRSPSHYGPKSALQLKTPTSLGVEASPSSSVGPSTGKSGQLRIKVERDEESSPQTPYSAPFSNSQTSLSGSNGFYNEAKSNDWLRSRDPTAVENTPSEATVDVEMTKHSVIANDRQRCSSAEKIGITTSANESKVFGSAPSARETKRYESNAVGDVDYGSSSRPNSASSSTPAETFSSMATRYENRPVLNETLSFASNPSSSGAGLAHNKFSKAEEVSMSSRSNDSMDYSSHSASNESSGPIPRHPVGNWNFTSNESNSYVSRTSSNAPTTFVSKAPSVEPNAYLPNSGFNEPSSYVRAASNDAFSYSKPVFNFPEYAGRPAACEPITHPRLHSNPFIGYPGRSPPNQQQHYVEARPPPSNQHTSYRPQTTSYEPMSYSAGNLNSRPFDSRTTSFEPLAFESKKSYNEFVSYDHSRSNDMAFSSRPDTSYDHHMAYSARSAPYEPVPYDTPMAFDCSPIETYEYASSYDVAIEGHSLSQEGLYSEKMSSQPKQHSTSLPSGVSSFSTFQYPPKVKVEPLHFEKTFLFTDSSFLTPPVRDSDDMILTSSFSNYSCTPTSAYPPWDNGGF